MHDQLATLIAELGISTQALIARGMQEYIEAEQLTIAEIETSGRQHLLVPKAADAWNRMKSAALADGISIYIVSAFRSIDRQIEIIRRKLEHGQEIHKILEVNAPPGFSEHHTGRAIDVATHGGPILEVAFEQTPAFYWLTNHASEFNFYMSYAAGNAQGYQYEPWHWCFDESIVHTKLT
jgi:zinc D-Ala-D-Ala carboxypeptidase